MAPSKKNKRILAPKSQSSDSAMAKDGKKESAIKVHRDESEGREDIKDQTQTSQIDSMTSAANSDKLAATEKITRTQEDPMCEQDSYFKDYEEYKETDKYIEEVPTPAKRSTGISHQMAYVITEKEVKKPYKESGSSTSTRTRKEPVLSKFVKFIYKNQSVTIGSEHWRSRLEQWRDDTQDEPWKYRKRSKESRKMGAVICDFEMPSDKAGLVLHCLVKHKETSSGTISHLFTVHLKIRMMGAQRKKLSRSISAWKEISQEAASNSVTFTSGNFETFYDLMWWASNGHLPPRSIYPDGKEMDERMQDDRPVVLIQLGFNWGGPYLLSNRLRVKNLMNLITDCVVGALELNRATLTKEDIAGVYKYTPKDCGLRRLACYSFNYYLDRCPPELWPQYYDVAKRIDGLEDDSAALRRGSHGGVVTFTGIWDFPPCHFHDQSMTQ